MEFLDLPDDILIRIVQELAVCDILSLRQTCTYASSLTRHRSIWRHLLRVEIIQNNVPVQSLRYPSTSESSAFDLERRVSESLFLHANWTSALPICSSVTAFHVTPDLAGHRVVLAGFLPGSHSRYLISFSSSSHLQCWDMHASPPSCIAYRRCRSIKDVLINSDHTHSATISAELSHGGFSDHESFILGLDRSARYPEQGFVDLNKSRISSYSLALHGSWLISADVDHVIHITNIDTNVCVASLLNPAPTSSEDFRCLRVFLGQGFIVKFCTRWILLYRLPDQKSTTWSRASNIAPRLEPECSFLWHWPIGTIVISPRVMGASSTSIPFLNLAVRFRSLTHGTVSVISRYVLPLRQEFETTMIGFDTPIPIASIPSPLSRHAPRDMVIGQYDTLLWIDSRDYTDEYQGQSRKGRRIAGKMLPQRYVEGATTIGKDHNGRHHILGRMVATRDRHDVARDLETERRTTPSYIEMTIFGMNFEPEGYSDQNPDSPPVLPSNSGREQKSSRRGVGGSSGNTANTIMRFHTDENRDVLNSLAMDEERRRIVVGTTIGTISILDYSHLPHTQTDLSPIGYTIGVTQVAHADSP